MSNAFYFLSLKRLNRDIVVIIRRSLQFLLSERLCKIWNFFSSSENICAGPKHVWNLFKCECFFFSHSVYFHMHFFKFFFLHLLIFVTCSMFKYQSIFFFHFIQISSPNTLHMCFICYRSCKFVEYIVSSQFDETISFHLILGFFFFLLFLIFWRIVMDKRYTTTYYC